MKGNRKMNYIEELYVVLANHTNTDKWRCVGTYSTFKQAMDSVNNYVKCLHLDNPNDYTLDATEDDTLNKYFLTDRFTDEIHVEFCVKQVFQRKRSSLF